MSTATKELHFLNGLFSENALNTLYKSDNTSVTETMHQMYDDTFIYGGIGVGNFKTWDIDTRHNISALHRAICITFDLVSIYIEAGNDVEKVKEILDGLIDNGIDCIQLLEDIMMLSVHFKYDEIGTPNGVEKNKADIRYNDYLIMKRVLKGYLYHP